MSADNEAETARKHAKDAVRRGDLVEAERWSKVAERLLALPPPEEQALDDEAVREELRRRLQRLDEADRDLADWEREPLPTKQICSQHSPTTPIRRRRCGDFLAARWRVTSISPPLRAATSDRVTGCGR